MLSNVLATQLRPYVILEKEYQVFINILLYNNPIFCHYTLKTVLKMSI